MLFFFVSIVSIVELTLLQWTNARNILGEQFGWPDNFSKERWNSERNEIWKRILHVNVQD
jgi:hypothetical protein